MSNLLNKQLFLPPPTHPEFDVGGFSNNKVFYANNATQIIIAPLGNYKTVID